MGKINMNEIAGLANVSIATVSRVIHSPHLVSPKTLDHVRRVIDKYNYVYHAPAGDLSRKNSKVIGLLLPTTRSPVFARTVLSIQDKCQEAGYAVILGNTRYEGVIERRLLTQFRERRVAGIILTGFTIGQEEALDQLVHSGITTVVIWERLDDEKLCYVGFDNDRAAFQATAHLLELGHRDVGLLIGPYSKVGRVKKRYQGYLDAMNKYGAVVRPEWVIETEPFMLYGEEAMYRILQSGQRPTAVFAASDVLAIGAMKAAKSQGLRIPEDLSLIGFDDIDFAAYTDPPLTTVQVPARKIGELAVEIILESVSSPSPSLRRYCLETNLIIRASTAPLKTGHIPVVRDPVFTEKQIPKEGR